MTADLECRTIDADGHVLEPDELYANYLPTSFANYRPAKELDDSGRYRLRLGHWLGEWKPAQTVHRSADEPERHLTGGSDPKARLQDMTSEGISHAVLFPTEAMAFAAVAEREAALAMSMAYNDWLGHYCAADPARLKHVAHVPFGNVQDACDELQRCKAEYDSVAVYLRPNPYPPSSPGKFPSDARNEDFWTAAEELDVTICFHEACQLVVPTPGADRFSSDHYALIHAAAHPISQMMAILEIIGTGVLARHPHLRVGFMEAGCAWLPSWLNRIDSQVGAFAGATRGATRPSEQFRRQCFVTTEGNELGLHECLAGFAQNVVFATDYPHSDCTFPGAPDRIALDDTLTEPEKNALLRLNAAHWFGIDA